MLAACAARIEKDILVVAIWLPRW